MTNFPISTNRCTVPFATLTLAVAFLAPCREASAQSLVLKRSLTLPAAPGCVATKPVVAAPVSRDNAEARRLVAAGQEAALQGDQRAARDAFVRAAALDPSDARTVYELGRLHEDLDERVLATGAYCRYLLVAAASKEADDVRSRLSRLLPSERTDAVRQGLERFRYGLTQFDAERFQLAEVAFDDAVRVIPTAPEALFNRSLARMSLGRRNDALRDLETYLSLVPNAEDRVAVARAFGAWRRPVYEPSAAFTRGLLPGFGQFYTDRAGRGVVVVGTVGAAIAAALYSRTETREIPFVDPNGMPAPFTESAVVYPYRTAGIAAAAGITLLAALEATLFARRSQRTPVQVRPRVTLRGESAVLLSVNF